MVWIRLGWLRLKGWFVILCVMLLMWVVCCVLGIVCKFMRFSLKGIFVIICCIGLVLVLVKWVCRILCWVMMVWKVVLSEDVCIGLCIF